MKLTILTIAALFALSACSHKSSNDSTKASDKTAATTKKDDGSTPAIADQDKADQAKADQAKADQAKAEQDTAEQDKANQDKPTDQAKTDDQPKTDLSPLVESTPAAGTHGETVTAPSLVAGAPIAPAAIAAPTPTPSSGATEEAQAPEVTKAMNDLNAEIAAAKQQPEGTSSGAAPQVAGEQPAAQTEAAQADKKACEGQDLVEVAEVDVATIGAFNTPDTTPEEAKLAYSTCTSELAKFDAEKCDIEVVKTALDGLAYNCDRLKAKAQ